MQPALKKWLQSVAIGSACALVAISLWRAGAMDRFEAKIWDWRVAKMAKPGPNTDRIKLILIDQDSLDWASTIQKVNWPWPREMYGYVLDFCRRQGARAVAFDMIYTEPSSHKVDDDQAFAEAIARTPGFVNTIFLGLRTGNEKKWPTHIPPSWINIDGFSPWLFDVNHRDCAMPLATFPIPEVATNAALLGNVEARPDPDAIIRRLFLFNVFDSQVVPTFGLATYLAAHTNVAMSIRANTFQLGGTAIPINHKGQAILRFRGPPETYQRYSAAAVIQSEYNLQEGGANKPPITGSNVFKDCYVLFGCNAPGLLDLRPTPLSDVSPGVELHATLLDNLLTGDFMRSAPRLWISGLVFILALLCAIVTIHGRNARDNLLALILALPIPMALCLLAYRQGYWLHFMALESAVVFALVSGILWNFAVEGKQKRFIRGAFKQYLSEDVVEQLVLHPERLSLGGELRELSIFFSDLKGFTSISEGLNPQELISLLNEYLTAMTDIIQEEGGTVDKYVGDAIVAFWNAPLSQADHAERAVRATLRCQATLAELRPQLKDKYGGKELFMRVGLNTGPVVVGNMGSRNRFNYTMLGDAANLASRLEGINKQFGTYTMISEATQAGMGQSFAVRELSRVAVVGRKMPVRVFEPMSPEAFASRKDVFDVFAGGLAAYYAGEFKPALKTFEFIQEKDPAAASYVRRCQAFLDHPPAAWDGVWVMTEK